MVNTSTIGVELEVTSNRGATDARVCGRDGDSERAGRLASC